jgi:hypothetical protein
MDSLAQNRPEQVIDGLGQNHPEQVLDYLGQFQTVLAQTVQNNVFFLKKN